MKPFGSPDRVAAFRKPGSERTIVVELYLGLSFWPYRALGEVAIGRTVIERAWRGPNVRSVVLKALADGCLALDGVDPAEAVAALELELGPSWPS